MANVIIVSIEKSTLPHADEYKVTYLWCDGAKPPDKSSLYVTAQDEIAAYMRLKTIALGQGHTVELGEQDGEGADITDWP
jgi:hypothetical protein